MPLGGHTQTQRKCYHLEACSAALTLEFLLAKVWAWAAFWCRAGVLFAGTNEDEDEAAPPGLTSDSAKEVRLSADGYRGSGDRLEELRPAEDLVRVVDSEAAPCEEELKEDGEASLLASATVASPEDESWEAPTPLLPWGCHEARRSRVPPPTLWKEHSFNIGSLNKNK